MSTTSNAIDMPPEQDDPTKRGIEPGIQPLSVGLQSEAGERSTDSQTRRPEGHHQPQTDTSDQQKYHDLTHPSLSPQAPSTNMNGIQYFDDNNSEDYEWVRMPKRGGYEICHILRGKPEDRDFTDVPLTYEKPDGVRVTLWAKLDTYADANVISRSTVEVLLGADAEQKMESHPCVFKTADGQNFQTEYAISLNFVAGTSKREFRDVLFVIKEDKGLEESKHDGMADVILGVKHISDHSMLMLDLEYCCEPDRGLQVIAEHARAEDPDVHAICQMSGDGRPGGMGIQHKLPKQEAFIGTARKIPIIVARKSPSGPPQSRLISFSRRR